MEAARDVAQDRGGSAEMEFAEVLQALEHESPRAAEVAVFRIVNGQTMPQVAEMLSISVATAERDWRFASAFLKAAYRESGHGVD